MACNKLFEGGFLSHEKIYANKRDVMENIDSGFNYFCDWFGALQYGGDFKPLNSKEKRYLSWQTWDLLRTSVYGFRDFIESFLQITLPIILYH